MPRQRLKWPLWQSALVACSSIICFNTIPQSDRNQPSSVSPPPPLLYPLSLITPNSLPPYPPKCHPFTTTPSPLRLWYAPLLPGGHMRTILHHHFRWEFPTMLVLSELSLIPTRAIYTSLVLLLVDHTSVWVT